MEQVYYDITLPLGEQPIRQVLTVKRFDSHATLWFRLTHGGRAYRITEDCMGVFTAKKPDGTVIYNPCRREGNAFVYSLTPQTTALPGQLRCELRLYGPGEKLITTAAFLLEVADTVYSGDEELASSQEAEALTQLIDHTRQNLDRMVSLLEQANSLPELIRQAQTNAEQVESLLREAETRYGVDDTAFGKQPWSARRILEFVCPETERTGQTLRCTPLAGEPIGLVSKLTETAYGLFMTRQTAEGEECWDLDISDFDGGIGAGSSYDWITGILIDDVGEPWQHDPEENSYTPISDLDGYETRQVRQLLGTGQEETYTVDCGTLTLTCRQDPGGMFRELSRRLEETGEPDVPLGPVISFQIFNGIYEAPEGMTWQDWVASEYNTKTYSCDDCGFEHLCIDRIEHYIASFEGCDCPAGNGRIDVAYLAQFENRETMEFYFEFGEGEYTLVSPEDRIYADDYYGWV